MIELVIKIPEDSYKATCNGCMLPPDVENIVQGIKNGTPLPKGHGDLIDISKLPVTTTYFGVSDKPTEVVNYNCILNAKKIIKRTG